MVSLWGLVMLKICNMPKLAQLACQPSPKQKRTNSLSPLHKGHSEQWHIVAVPKLNWSKGPSLNFIPSVTAAIQKGCLVPFPQGMHVLVNGAIVPRTQHSPGSATCCLHPGRALFLFTGICSLPETVMDHTSLHSWSSFGGCSSMASTASKKHIRIGCAFENSCCRALANAGVSHSLSSRRKIRIFRQFKSV